MPPATTSDSNTREGSAHIRGEQDNSAASVKRKAPASNEQQQQPALKRKMSPRQSETQVINAPEPASIVVLKSAARPSPRTVAPFSLHAHPELMLQVLAAYLDISSDRNERLPQVYDARSSFHCFRPPSISTLDYLGRIELHAECSPVCFLIATVYLERLAAKHGPEFMVCALNTHRMWIVALLLAVKFFEDLYYDNVYYGRLGGLPVDELNALELEMFSRLDFSLNVSEEELASVQLAVVKEVVNAPSPSASELRGSLAKAGLVQAADLFRS